MNQNPGISQLISWWNLDETSGMRYDAHGSNHLTDVNTVGYQTGKKGNAADFEWGNAEYLTINDNPSLSFGDEDMTMGVWIKVESFSTGAEAIFGKWGAVDEYHLYIGPTVNSPRFAVNNGSVVTVVDWGSVLSVGVWYFIMGWHDSVNNQIGICVNNGTPVTASHTGGILDGASAFRFGSYDPIDIEKFDGLMDEVFLYRKLLSADERSWLWNGGLGRTYQELLTSQGISGVFLSDYGVM